MPQALGVVHILVSGKPTEDGLPQHPDKSMPAILAGSRIRDASAQQIRPGTNDTGKSG